jgi:nucleoside-diphosphate-sugar epimerase
MKIVIAGAHGKIAMLLAPRMIARGDTIVGLIRNPAHAREIESTGARAVVCDLEQATVDQLVSVLAGADAAVFAAGAGAGSGAARKLTVDRDGAIKLLEAATAAGVPRFVIVSSVGAEDPPGGDEVFSVYLQAKAAADDAVRVSDRQWTIVRPGRLTDAPPTGRARIDRAPFRGEVSRADVATVLALLLPDPRAYGATLYVNGGEAPIESALVAALS